MSDKTQEIIDSVKCQLMDKPLSVSEISEKLKINWRTAENYLEILKKLDLVKEINREPIDLLRTDPLRFLKTYGGY